MRERDIEKHLIKRIKEFDGMVLKFTSSISGVPDRVVICQGSVFFVEVKRPGEIPSSLQFLTHTAMKKRGAKVYVVDSKVAIDLLIEDMDFICLTKTN